MTDITELAQREKFEAWAEERCALPWGYLKNRRTNTGYFSKHDYTSLWAAWKAAGAELVEALEKAQQHIADLDPFHAAFKEWSDKTAWVQTDKRFDVLKPWGKHHADVLKEYIQHLESRTVMLERQLVGRVDEKSLTTINPAPTLHLLPKNAESLTSNSPVNDATVGKPFTILLPDISSKAFWSGAGKNETFHPETYRRWVKEAIERYCAIARIDVEVK